MFPPESIQAKIDRADEHIGNLNTEINDLINSDAYRTVSKPVGDAREASIRIIGPEPPIRWAVIAGEIVHQLRSSLDHLVGQLAIANGMPVKRSHQFPICDTPENFEEAVKRGNVQGISASARALIESRQPYNRSKDLKDNFLYVLREMDNADKHRVLPIVIALGNASELAIGDSSRPRPKDDSIVIVGFSKPTPAQRPTKDGTEVLRIKFGAPEPNVQVEGRPAVQILFDDPGLPDTPAIHILQQLRDKTLALIDDFAGEIAEH